MATYLKLVQLTLFESKHKVSWANFNTYKRVFNWQPFTHRSITKTFLMVSSFVKSKQLSCSVHRQLQKRANKNIQQRTCRISQPLPLINIVYYQKARFDDILLSYEYTSSTVQLRTEVWTTLTFGCNCL